MMTRDDVENMCDVIASVETDWLVRTAFSRAIRDHDATQRDQLAAKEREIERLKGELEAKDKALRNVFALARSMNRNGDNSDNLQHILRFCREGGMEENILRDEQAHDAHDVSSKEAK